MASVSPLISVIVPMYNSAPYINKCLRSVLGQTYREIQVLVIDDGSNDNSCDLVKSFAADDSRVELIRNEGNYGVSVARNVGLKFADGEYVVFLDSDDFLERDFAEKLIELASQNKSDMVFCGYRFVSSNFDCQREVIPTVEESKTYSGLEIFQKIILGSVSIWTASAMYRRQMLCESGISFVPGAKNGQDREFIWKAVIRSNSMTGTKTILSNYLQREQSLVRNCSLSKMHSLGCKLRFEKYLAHVTNNSHLLEQYRREILFPSYIELVYFLVSSGLPQRELLNIVKNNGYRRQMARIGFGKSTFKKFLAAKGLRHFPLTSLRLLKIRDRWLRRHAIGH